MINTYYLHILNMIHADYFVTCTDAIDYIQEFYKAGKITLTERNKLINIINA